MADRLRPVRRLAARCCLPLLLAGCAALTPGGDFKPLGAAEIAALEAARAEKRADGAGDRADGSPKAAAATEAGATGPEAGPAPGETAAPTAAAPTAAAPAPEAPTAAAREAEERPKGGDEFSEAELAGEVEADPDEIAVPEEPPDDGLAHDFVTVYSSRPDRPVEEFAGLPGVVRPDGLVQGHGGGGFGPLSGSAAAFFAGERHPFARIVPAMPLHTVRAMNGLLLDNAGISVTCVKPDLLALIRRAEGRFGHPAVITSGYRSPGHNARVRGAIHSQHLYCNALDLYMPGVARDDLARYFFDQPDRGGLGIYCHTRSIHIDTGRRREWRWSCRRPG